MNCYCKDEFEWLINMLKKGDCFLSWEDVSDFIDTNLLQLRYMKKRFGYLFYDHYKYIIKVDGRNAICVSKDDHFVCRKPDQAYHFKTIPLEDKERFKVLYLDEIDKGEPFITFDEKQQDKYVKETKNILKKIKLVKLEIYNSDKFYNILYSKDFDDIELEKDREKFYEQFKTIILDEILPTKKNTPKKEDSDSDSDLNHKLFKIY